MTDNLENNLIELENIYQHLKNFNNNDNDDINKLSIVKGKLKYFHYDCDNFNDAGWGCGYRTTQTLCSWIRNQLLKSNPNRLNLPQVPTILEMQKILVDSGDKSSRFVGSREWIGCFESSIIIDTLYDISSKILHSSNNSLLSSIQSINDHFVKFGSPIMMGGDLDNASKAILGVLNANKFLVVDPHFLKRKDSQVSIDELIENSWISWQDVNQYNTNNSFYNFCMPQLKYT
jgi:hypothetical protein